MSNERSNSPPPRPSSRQLSEVLSELAEELKCSICLDHFSDPVFLPCHHTFCDTCVRSLASVASANTNTNNTNTNSSPSYAYAAADDSAEASTADRPISAASSSTAVASSSSSTASSVNTNSASSHGADIVPAPASPVATVTCPLCRAECGVPAGGRFPINFQMRNLVERIKPLGKFKKCGRCRSRAATIFCFACELFMCERCDEDEPMHSDPALVRAEVAGVSTITTPPAYAAASASSGSSTPAPPAVATALDQSAGELPRSDSVPSFASLRKSSDSSTSLLVHVRVPVIDAVAILQLRRADAELEAGTLGAQMIPPLVTRDQCAQHLKRWLGSSWLPRGDEAGVRRLAMQLTFVPHWAWKCETLAAGSIQPLIADMPHVDARTRSVQFPVHGNGGAHCSLRAWRRPVLVCATSEISGSNMARLGPWDFEKVERLPDAAPEHPTARLALADIAQRDAWPEAERRVEQEAVEELESELRRRAGLQSRAVPTAGVKSDIVVTSKTVRRLWLPIWTCKYVIANADTGEDEEFVCFVNAQSGRCFGERPSVSASRLLGVVGIGLSLVVAPLAAYRLAKSGPW